MKMQTHLELQINGLINSHFTQYLSRDEQESRYVFRTSCHSGFLHSPQLFAL